MLVEINLLPYKPRKSKLAIYISLFIMLLAAICILIGVLLYKGHQSDLEFANRQINSTRELIAATETQILELEQENDTEILLDKVGWVLDQQKSGVYVLHHFVSLLPERGFFINYGYNESGSLTLTTQFDNQREVAHYLFELNQSNYTTKATLNTITTSSISTGEEDVRMVLSDYVPRYRATFSIDLGQTPRVDELVQLEQEELRTSLREEGE